MNRIQEGKSYPHKHDGSISRNDQKILPVHESDYYREYVHPTHGVKHAGLQRMIIGKGGELYYTPDHYETFIRFK
jgi:filamentous hemagglutinin